MEEEISSDRIDPEIAKLLPEYYDSFRKWEETCLNSEEVPSFSKIYHKTHGWIAESGNFARTKKDPSLHSEIQTIQQARILLDKQYLTDCTLFSNLEPCFLCAAHIIKARLDRVVYFSRAERGQGISHLPIETLYQSYHFPELIYVSWEKLGKQKFRKFFQKIRNPQNAENFLVDKR